MNNTTKKAVTPKTLTRGLYNGGPPESQWELIENQTTDNGEWAEFDENQYNSPQKRTTKSKSPRVKKIQSAINQQHIEIQLHEI